MADEAARERSQSEYRSRFAHGQKTSAFLRGYRRYNRHNSTTTGGIAAINMAVMRGRNVPTARLGRPTLAKASIEGRRSILGMSTNVVNHVQSSHVQGDPVTVIESAAAT